MERKLASIRKVSAIYPIENRDKIEVAQVDGWQCIVKKGEFKTGDLGVFFEIDSFLPIQERYEFLRKSSFRTLEDGTEGFRLKTIRMAGQLSQGLLLPLSEFPEIKLQSISPDDNIGMDLTGILGVKKYDLQESNNVRIPKNRELTKVQKAWKWVKPFVPSFVLKQIYRILPSLTPKRVSAFPSFIRKTDQERIQNCLDFLTQHWTTRFEVTQKLDGSSLTAYQYKGKFGVCSRNVDLRETKGNEFWETAKKYQLDKVLAHLCKSGRNLALQGEMCGPSIQGNYEQIPETVFFLFDVFDIDQQRYLTPKERNSLALHELGIEVPVVPSMGEFTLQEFFEEGGFTNEVLENLTASKLSRIATPFVEEYTNLYQSIMRQQKLEILLEFADGPSAINPEVRREGMVFKSCDLVNGQVASFKVISNGYLEKEK